MKKIKQTFIYISLIALSIFIGYENPKLVENPKKYYKHLFEKEKIIEKKVKNIQENEDEIKLNSFDLAKKIVLNFDDKSAFLEINDAENDASQIKVFTQNGYFENKEKIQKLNTPLSFYKEKEGGVRSIFKIEQEYFALISNKNLNCYYASILRLSDGNKIINSKCLPDVKNINFAGLGGGYVDVKDYILIAIGTPTHSSDEIDLLSQNDNSIFGKILKIAKKDLLNKNLKEVKYEFFSKGHRNPQGMAVVNKNIYAIEHGPRGGDEINIIKPNRNYGWPINSYGLTYDKKKRYHHQKLAKEHYDPIYAFLPSIAPSALSNCPSNLREYYSSNICLLGLSLRAMSLFVFLLDKDNSNLIAIEKVYLEKRLRHFGLKKDLSLHEDKDNSFYITTDDYEVIKIKFKNFKKAYVNN